MSSRTPARPFVTANFAVTADGKVSTRKLTPSDFSSPRDKHRLLEIRATADAVLAGVGTIAADNMSMGLPSEDLRKQRLAKGLPEYPVRVLVSNSGRISPDLRVFQQDCSPVLIFSTSRMPRKTQAALGSRATLYLQKEGNVDLAAMLSILRSRHRVKRVVCEGGPTLFRSMLETDLIDELHVTICPRIFGGVKAPTLTGKAGAFLQKSKHLRLRDMEIIGNECFLRYRVAR